MTCIVGENIVICRPTLDGWQRWFMRCFNCKRRRLVLGEFQDYYGWRVTCLTCGDSWSDGEVAERPFERGWRKRTVAEAKARMKRYLEAGIPQGLAAFDERLRIQLEQQRSSGQDATT